MDIRSSKKRERKSASSVDFLNRSSESVVFSRDHRVIRRFVSKGATLSKKNASMMEPRLLDGVARPIRNGRDTSVSSLSSLGRSRGSLLGFQIRAFLPSRYALKLSLIGAVLFGVASTTLVYRYLGERALAREEIEARNTMASEHLPEVMPEAPTVLGESDEARERFAEEVVQDLEDMRVAEEKQELEKKIRAMVAGYPIEEMVPFILEKDKMVAAFLVGIAKKESAWGKRVPLLREHDCFNYWGYRGKRRFMGTGGHTCFNSPKDAVDTVSRRLEKLIFSEKVDTPAEMMVVWKCGYDCSGHTKADTKKWIQDVDLYFHQLDEE
jgi:hypothetical protein